MTRAISGELPVGFRYTPGVGNTAFLEGLRDRAAFLGSHCDHCGITVVPARIFCERCFAELTPDAECGPAGTLVSWTVVRIGVDGEPLATPEMFALVRLDRADSVFLHRLIGIERPEAGMRVRARVSDRRAGSILDIDGFEPEAES
jgi:uncharacterized protein